MSDLLKQVYDVVDAKQGDDIRVIDFRGHSPFFDYMLIATARNERLAMAIIDAVEDLALSLGLEAKHIDKVKDSKWFLIDLGAIVVHVFYDGQREYYDLEGLWKDLGILKM